MSVFVVEFLGLVSAPRAKRNGVGSSIVYSGPSFCFFCPCPVTRQMGGSTMLRIGVRCVNFV